MTKTLNTSALRDLLGQHGASKPEGWATIPMVEEGEQRAEFLKALNGAIVPSFTELALFGATGDTCYFNFKIEVPQFFYVERGDQAFLVNTEGYTYIREAIRVL